MKKIFLLTVLGMMLMSDAMMAGEKISLTPSSMDAWINLRITFHRPKLNCERGFGICFEFTVGFDEISNFENSEHSTCPIRMQLNERNQLLMEVQESELAKYEGGATLANFKGKSSITLEDPFTLSKKSSQALGSSTPLVIKAGEYPVSYSNGLYSVTFQL